MYFPVFASSRQNPTGHTLFTDTISLDFKSLHCTDFKLATANHLVLMEVRSFVPSFPDLTLSHLFNSKATTRVHQYKYIFLMLELICYKALRVESVVLIFHSL